MEKVSVFEHLAVKKISVSNNERYILSFNGTINDAPNTEVILVSNYFNKKSILLRIISFGT
jgi:hypothetical protein